MTERRTQQSRRKIKTPTVQPGGNNPGTVDEEDETVASPSPSRATDTSASDHGGADDESDTSTLASSEGGQGDNDAAVTAQDMQAAKEMREQQETNSRVMKDKDFRNRICNITVHFIWSRMKYCDLDSGFGEHYKKLLAKELDRTEAEIENKWKTIKTITNQCLRARRSYVTQMMKGNFFGMYKQMVLFRSSVWLLTTVSNNHGTKRFPGGLD